MLKDQYILSCGHFKLFLKSSDSPGTDGFSCTQELNPKGLQACLHTSTQEVTNRMKCQKFDFEKKQTFLHLFLLCRWRGSNMLPMSSDRHEQNSDYSLRLRSVGLVDLGPYTCQSYNGLGAPASFTVMAKAVGPVTASSREEESYLSYVVDAPTAPELTQRPMLGPEGVYR